LESIILKEGTSIDDDIIKEQIPLLLSEDTSTPESGLTTGTWTTVLKPNKKKNKNIENEQKVAFKDHNIKLRSNQ
jgi:hypothetical protein